MARPDPPSNLAGTPRIDPRRPDVRRPLASTRLRPRPSAATRASSPAPSAPHLRPFPSSVNSPSPRRALTLVVVAVAFSRSQRAARRRALLRRAAPTAARPSPYPAAPRRVPQWLTHATGMLQSPATARISHGKAGFGFLRRCAAAGVRRRRVPLPPARPTPQGRPICFVRARLHLTPSESKPSDQDPTA